MLLFEAVAGKRPFEADSALDVYDQIVRREPVRLPGKLGAITARALEKDPRRRYPSAEALAEDLGHCLRGEPISIPVLWPRLRRHLPVATVSLVVAAMALLSGLLFRQYQEAIRAAREAALRPGVAESDMYTEREERASEALLRHPRDVKLLIRRSMNRQKRGDTARDHGRSPLTFYQAALDDADKALEIEADSREALLQRSRVFTQRAVYKARHGIDPLSDCDAAEASLTRALSEAELRPLRGNIRYHRGVWLNRNGKNGRPDLLAAEADLTPAADWESYLKRGRVRAALGKLDEAEQDYAIALDAAARRRLGLDPAGRGPPAGRRPGQRRALHRRGHPRRQRPRRRLRGARPHPLRPRQPVRRPARLPRSHQPQPRPGPPAVQPHGTGAARRREVAATDGRRATAPAAPPAGPAPRRGRGGRSRGACPPGRRPLAGGWRRRR